MELEFATSHRDIVEASTLCTPHIQH